MVDGEMQGGGVGITFQEAFQLPLPGFRLNAPYRTVKIFREVFYCGSFRVGADETKRLSGLERRSTYALS